MPLKLTTKILYSASAPPLGDFRHTMHVGRGGDVFGDTSFLSNHGGGSSPSACLPEIHRGSLTDTGIPSFPCSDSISPSDSMNSFTLDLGPSLMSEVFAMIDSPVCEKADPIITCEPNQLGFELIFERIIQTGFLYFKN
uniref:CDC42 effector protein (Rho GTPase binding) 1a n=2 Tax=Cyprinus carpio TaxID=7962 RepID=A0A8C1TR58_CYPCA